MILVNGQITSTYFEKKREKMNDNSDEKNGDTNKMNENIVNKTSTWLDKLSNCI